MLDFGYKLETFFLLLLLLPLLHSIQSLSLSHFLFKSLNSLSLKVCIPPSIALLSFSRIEKIVSRATPFSETISQTFLSMETHYIRALNSNERITLFSFPHLLTWYMHSLRGDLFFYLNQFDYELSLPFFFVFSTLGFLRHPSDVDLEVHIIYECFWGNVPG